MEMHPGARENPNLGTSCKIEVTEETEQEGADDRLIWPGEVCVWLGCNETKKMM